MPATRISLKGDGNAAAAAPRRSGYNEIVFVSVQREAQGRGYFSEFMRQCVCRRLIRTFKSTIE
jgi:hypothetical protein